ncbi:ParB/Srx family N-terminal domain-containing protein, partial [Candidatus Magnetaquicoccus inordinatus]|uniref:ParB/Srx family N-terminal domain-containing protein n=1 Tax=Candidatus Magnetaquicoccus inordinatus TaxID=2496818 RepID=UPI001D0E5230
MKNPISDIIMAQTIEIWQVDRLIPYSNNARTHTDEQVAMMAASIKEFGFTNPIQVDSKDGIIAGHCRLMAARKLGLEQVPVIILDHLSDAQRRALILADNKLSELAGWDWAMIAVERDRLIEDGYDVEVIGFTDEDLAHIADGLLDGSEADGAGGDEGGEESIPEPPKNPVTRTGDLWILGEHRLLCGDSTKAEDVIRLMNGERAILFATDPPYLVDYTGGNHPPSRVNPATGKRRGGGKDWTDTYGKTWDDADQGPELYQGYMRQAIDHAINDHAAWYCWHASKRQAMVEAVWEEMGAFVHQT